MIKQAYFETLSEALEAENLLDIWANNFPYGEQAIKYGETFHKVLKDGSKYGRCVSIYRSDTTGRYERPVHYAC